MTKSSLWTALFFFVAVILTTACALGDNYPHVENIIPKEAMSQTGYYTVWTLSPAGDKIVYLNAEDNYTLLYPATQHQVEISDPRDRMSVCWCDNRFLGCLKGLIYDAQLDYTVPITHYGYVEKMPTDITTDLSKADIIYAKASNDLIDLTALTIGTEDKVIAGLTVNSVRASLEDLNLSSYIEMPLCGSGLSKYPEGQKYYSPDGQYYLLVDNVSLAIHRSDSDEMLSQFSISQLQDGKGISPNAQGWASDSSGVYFDIRAPGCFTCVGGGRGNRGGVRKLTVPVAGENGE